MLTILQALSLAFARQFFFYSGSEVSVSQKCFWNRHSYSFCQRSRHFLASLSSNVIERV